MKVYYVLAIPVALNMMGPWPVVVLYLIRRMMIRRKNKNLEDELHHGGGNMEEIYSGVPVLTDWRASLVEK